MLARSAASLPIILRDYQEKEVDDSRAAFKTHRRVCLVAPTRSGKTPVFIRIAQLASRKGKRITITAHRRRIVREISKTLDRFGLRHGLIVPGHAMTADTIQIGMIQTLARRLPYIQEPDLWINDECHHSAAGTYRKVSEAWKKALHLGATATPARLDGKPLKDAYDVIVMGPTSAELRRAGWLAEFTYYAPPPKADLSKVKTTMGDFSLAEMSMEMDKAVVYGDIIAHWEKLALGTRTLVSCCNVDHCKKVAAAFNAKGYRFDAIYGDLGDDACERLMNALESGRLDGLTFCDLLDEGVTIDGIRTVIMARRTKSLTKYLQTIGRVMGMSAETALIIDHVNNQEIHGLPDDPRVWSLEGKAKSEGIATRTCRTCFKVFAAAEAKPCGAVDCGFEAGPAAEPRTLETVDGELVAVASAWEWADGIDVARASGDEWQALLRKAGTDREKINQIRRARGYKIGWVKHVLAANAERELQKIGILGAG